MYIDSQNYNVCACHNLGYCIFFKDEDAKLFIEYSPTITSKFSKWGDTIKQIAKLELLIYFSL